MDLTRMPPITVSVAMSVHNDARYLAEAVASIQGQTLKDFEFVIVDDGSTDGTPGLLREMAARDARIRVIRQAHRGLTVSLNVAWRAARGEFIARMDADDVSLADRLNRQLAYLRYLPDYVAVGCQMLFIDEDGDPVLRHPLPTEHEEIDRLHLEGRSGIIPHPGAMIRRSALERVGGYREAFPVSQDYDLWLRLGEIGRLGNLPDVLLHYRTRLGNISARKCRLQCHLVRAALLDACRRRKLPEPAWVDQQSGGSDAGDPHDHRLRWVIQAANQGYRRTAWKQLRRLMAHRGGLARGLRGLAYVVFPVRERERRRGYRRWSCWPVSAARRSLLLLADAAAAARLTWWRHR